MVVGAIGTVTSLGRLWLGNSSALGENLWAEDGLFALCVQKAGFLSCLVDPFAGYWLFLPRVLALPISLAPVEMWAWVANLIAAILAGSVSAAAFYLARRYGLGVISSLGIALLPVLAPMVGLEAINAIGSSYMLLLFLSTLVVLLYSPQAGNWSGMVLPALLLALTALTIPSAVVLVGLVVIQVLRGAVPRRYGLVWLAGLVLGLVGQFVVASTAITPRPLNVSAESFDVWASSVPISLLTFWPGLSLGEYSFFLNFTMAPLGITGWLVVGVIVALGLWKLVAGWGLLTSSRAVIGQLLLAGLAFGLIPSVIGYTNNRYFVVPLLLWGAAALIWLDPWIRRARPWVLAIAGALILAVWWPAIPASEFRSTPAPPWTAEVARMKAKCLADPGFVERPIFSPYWPPNWGDGLDEPTHPNLPCTYVLRWLG